MAYKLSNKEKLEELDKELTMVAFNPETGERLITYEGIDAITLAVEVRRYTANCGGVRIMVFRSWELPAIHKIETKAKVDEWVKVATKIKEERNLDDPKRWRKIA